MNSNQANLTQNQQIDLFGRKVAMRLTAGTADLPYEVSERLRAARMQAIAGRKRVQTRLAPQVSMSGGAAALGFDDEGISLWQRIASVVPLFALCAGLVFIHLAQNESRASELAEVDVALLTDDLPPAAYADPGFVQFLKSARGGDGTAP